MALTTSDEAPMPTPRHGAVTASRRSHAAHRSSSSGPAGWLVVAITMWLVVDAPAASAASRDLTERSATASGEVSLRADESAAFKLHVTTMTQSTDQGKESDPLSVIIPVVLVGVWAGMGVLMFRRARDKRPPPPPS